MLLALRASSRLQSSKENVAVCRQCLSVFAHEKWVLTSCLAVKSVCLAEALSDMTEIHIFFFLFTQLIEEKHMSSAASVPR